MLINVSYLQGWCLFEVRHLINEINIVFDLPVARTPLFQSILKRKARIHFGAEKSVLINTVTGPHTYMYKGQGSYPNTMSTGIVELKFLRHQ